MGGPWTFLMWFELPSDLDEDPNETYRSSAERQTMLEDVLWADVRWGLRRTRMAMPAGHGDKQSFLIFVSADGKNRLETEHRLREEISGAVAEAVPGAELTWVMEASVEWLPEL
jgi:hypothetical protein